MIQAKETGQPYDAEELAAAVRRSVAETVREQAASGVDIVNDGEFSKAGFSDYIKDRVSGLGGVDPSPQAPTEVDFPEFAEWWRGVGFLGSVAFPRPAVRRADGVDAPGDGGDGPRQLQGRSEMASTLRARS